MGDNQKSRAERMLDAGHWPNCTVPDCGNKIAFGLSESLCFPHFFKLPIDQDGRAVYPDKETEAYYQRFCRKASGFARKEVETKTP